jgi:hypothetical protein
MKAVLCTLALAFVAQSYAMEDFDMVDESRTINFNTTTQSSGLVLLGAVLVLAAAFAAGVLVMGGSVASPFGSYYNRNDYQSYDPYTAEAQYGQYRSAQNGFLDGLNILSLLSMAQDAYENFDYNDLDCQKRLVCEVMKEPEYYGSVATKFATGFEYAKYLELMNMPDDIRELLDEYLDANSRAKDQKTCQDFFTCPYSIKDSMKRNVAVSNNL